MEHYWVYRQIGACKSKIECPECSSKGVSDTIDSYGIGEAHIIEGDVIVPRIVVSAI